VPAGNNLIVYNRWTSGSSPPTLNYITKDHLGSSAAITDKNGALVVKEKFSALEWRENTSAEKTTIGGITRHGYTGHEVLDNLSMVNMNGRVYIPSGSVMLSPDPYISDPTDTRSYNRYAYARYNPLTNIDPTGFDDWSAIDESESQDPGPNT